MAETGANLMPATPVRVRDSGATDELDRGSSSETSWLTVDRWIALLAGRRVWSDAEEVPSTATRLAAGMEIGGLLVAIGVLWTYRLTAGSPSRSFWISAAPVAFTISLGVMLVWPVWTVVGRPMRPARFWIQLPMRLCLAAVVVASTFATMPGWASLAMWPFGVAVGGDTAATAWSIGWETTPLSAYRDSLRSPVHLGIVGGLVGVVASYGKAAGLAKALPIYVTFQVWVLVGILLAAWLGMLRRSERAEQVAVAQQSAKDEHRKAAHWLHDDICSELRYATIKVQSRSVDMSQVEEMLENLDHRLRLRQLDELLESGSVRLAVILQPYLRRAQVGASICEVPAFEQASLVVDSKTGRLFSRAAAVMTANALNAGSSVIGFAVAVTTETVALTVTDNGGGFDGSSLPIGRGLWSLEHEPGVQSVEISSVPGGSRVRVTITISDRGKSGEPPPC